MTDVRADLDSLEANVENLYTAADLLAEAATRLGSCQIESAAFTPIRFITSIEEKYSAVQQRYLNVCGNGSAVLANAAAMLRSVIDAYRTQDMAISADLHRIEQQRETIGQFELGVTTQFKNSPIIKALNPEG